MSNEALKKKIPLSADRRVAAGDGVQTGEGLVVEMPVRERESPGDRRSAREVRLDSGRRARFGGDGETETLMITSPEGKVELSVRFTEDGPVLEFEAAGIRLHSGGEVDVKCASFRVDAGEVRLESEEDLVQRAGGRAEVEGRTVGLRSRRGNVDVKANDDVRLRGERIKLNC